MATPNGGRGLDPAGRAPFSFHCIVCYEAFRIKTRPPVVLPCGHTFVCEPCAARLTSCVECRTSLYVTAPSGSGAPAGGGGVGAHPPPPHHYGHGAAAARHNHRRVGSWGRYGSPAAGRNGGSPTLPHSHPPPQKVEKIPLPRPKNVVMIAMMEAAEARRRAGRRRRRSRSGGGGESVDETNSVASTLSDDDDDDDDDDSKVYESGDDDSAVRVGMNSLSARYGTYAVRATEGLMVLRRRPLHRGEPNQQEEPLTSRDQVDPVEKIVDQRDVALRSATASTEEDDSFQEDYGSISDGATSPPKASPNSKLLPTDATDTVSTDGPRKAKEGSEEQGEGSVADNQVDDSEAEDTSCCCDPSKQTQNDAKEEGEVEGEEGGRPVPKEEPKPRDEKQIAPTNDKNPAQEASQDFHITYGQTVQVIGFVDGVATLARGMGHIVTGEDQLVKVGPPLDEACKIEGKLFEASASVRRHEAKLAESKRFQASLEDDLREALSRAAKDNTECPVIRPPPTESKTAEDTNDKEKALAHDKESAEHVNESLTPARAKADSPTPENQRHLGVPVTPQTQPVPQDAPSSAAAFYSDSPHTIDNSDVVRSRAAGAGDIPRPGEVSIPTLRRRAASSHRPALLGCPLTPFLGTESDRHLEEAEASPIGARLSLDSEIEVGPDGVVVGASSSFGDRHGAAPSSAVAALRPPQTPDRSHGRSTQHHHHPAAIPPSPSTSFDAIDYRTGFSCHRGVGSGRHRSDHVSVHVQEERARDGMRMMGEHRGIGTLRLSVRRSQRPSSGGSSQQGGLDLLHHSSLGIARTTTGED